MEANNFIAKLKASDSDKNNSDLKEALERFKVILFSLPSKNKGSFALNVLCILCRNLEKVPSWRSAINNTDLTAFCIECVRHTRTLPRADLVKTLACVYHSHKHIIRQNSKIPPELVLKLSFMPFECEEESLLSDYYKTYWSILVDRLTYIDKLKTMRLPVIKLLPKFIEDVIKVIKMYDAVQFCTNLITYLVKKIHSIYNDLTNVNGYIEKIFECVSRKDLQPFKALRDEDVLDIYTKFNDCLFVISDNCLKNNDPALNSITRICITILGHRPDMFHCLQMVYSNAFCCIINDKTNVNLIDNVLKCLVNSCELTEKLGYEKILLTTYPYISQLLRLFIENIVNNIEITKYLSEAIQSNCLKLMLYLIPKLKRTNQLSKCENCNIRSGLHDALRLTFLVKSFITVSTNNGHNLRENLPLCYEVIEHQYSLLQELNSLGCGNYRKCLTKLQTDTHNSAILLNKSKYYEYSIKLFEIYLKNEFKNGNDIEMKNISRALYNKSICELDNKLYTDSLKNAFLSLIFSLPEALNNEKHMSLVMDIKAKAAKNSTDSNVQTLSVLDACNILICDHLYGNLEIFIKNLEFSELLKHEFTMYIKLWPSITPIAGVWKSMHDLTMKKVEWVKEEDQRHLLWSLYEIVVETPTAVRTIHDDTYRRIVYEMLELFELNPPKLTTEKVVYATLLCLKSEYKFTEASLKYGWKNCETDPDAPGPCVLHEHAAATAARRAVRVLLGAGGGDVPPPLLRGSLRVLQVCVVRLLQLCECVGALQLAASCCRLAEELGDTVSFVRNAGVLVSRAHRPHADVQSIINKSGKYCKELLNNPRHLDVALNFVCEVAIYYSKCGKSSVSSRLVQSVQAQILSAYEVHSDINLDLSLGRLMEAQAQLCSDLQSARPSTLSALNTTHRHYLALASSESRWCSRRLSSLTIKLRASVCGAQCVRVGRALRVGRRARCSAAGVRGGAARRARACADVVAAGGADAQIKIDNCLKYVLGLENPSPNAVNQTKTAQPELFTPKHTNLETMRDCMLKKTQVSPSVPCITVPGFQIPNFLLHAEGCTCHACELPACTVLACMICYLEASAYYRAKEMEIARNYFNGASKAFELAEVKLRDAFEGYKTMSFKEFIVDLEKEKALDDLKNVQLEFLIEKAYFELSLSDFQTSDECVVRIHDVMAELRTVDPYLCNEVYNLMIASAELRKSIKKPKEMGLEVELENLKLSPAKGNELQKTPETKVTLPRMDTVKVVKDEDIPKKRKVIKLNLDEAAEDEKMEEKVTRSRSKRPQFKVPEPVTSKPVLENMTPRPRSGPTVVIRQPSSDRDCIFTPKSSAPEFFTPCQSTPGEQFFTPMTSLKTYSKRIIKNLEEEFSTPKGKENNLKDKNAKSKAERGSALKDKKVLKRATSPGKLEPERCTTRPRRIRQPILDK